MDRPASNNAQGRQKAKGKAAGDQRPARPANEPFARGTRLLREKSAQAAIAHLKEAYRIDPENAEIALNLGGAYILTGRFKQARALLEPTSERHPDHAMVWTNLAAAYLGNPVLATAEDQERAISAFEQALALAPGAPHVAYNIGLIYRDRRDFDEAAAWFRRAVRHDPRDRDARRLLHKMERKRQEQADED